MKLITVKASINAPLSQVWKKWTNVHHVTKWNFASPDWYCPSAKNNFVEGGEFHYTMAANDGSFCFDFWGTYQKIAIKKALFKMKADGGHCAELLVLFWWRKRSMKELTEIYGYKNELTAKNQKARCQKRLKFLMQKEL